MTQLWIPHHANECVAQPIDGDLVALSFPTPRVIAREELGAITEPVLARSVTARGVESRTLLEPASAAVRVNGAPLPIGLRTLADRDAISVVHSGVRHLVYLSLERRAEIVPFPADRPETCCIRCKLPLLAGTPAVRCPSPNCAMWSHQSADQPCWTYADSCAHCGHPTDFDAGLQWSPEAL